ncbi:sensor histidine kinase [Blautia marasmi]|uniref:sensor histidine kinase n=1 Tax=Blautia marasmi TaxID=1917868 RepID=UPI00131A214D|nr:histidine kinase [Blautia marasmi]
MRRLWDKSFIFIFCTLNLAGYAINTPLISALLLSLSVTALISYLDRERSRDFLCGICIAVSLFYPGLAVFLPVIYYDCQRSRKRLLQFVWFPAYLYHFHNFTVSAFFLNLMTGLLAVYISRRTIEYEKMMTEFHSSQDSTREESLYLEQRNRELLEKQEYEIQLATLTERNRIAREIHDNVGHLLTRSLFQIRAMQVVWKEQEELAAQLSAVKSTLDDAMNNVRSSVHNLYEESVDLQMVLSRLTREFTFCPAALDYNAKIESKELKYCVIAIVREALSNISRHSNATEASVSVLEHPGFYQLIIQDNGTQTAVSGSGGIGLMNMRERVEDFHGIFRTENKNGFRIFISIPKQSEQVSK